MPALYADGTLYTYNADGTIASLKDAAGKVTSYTYDANGHVSAIISGGVTELYTYDEAGSLTGYTDARGNVYSYTYNADGMRTSETVNGKTTSYTIDANGNRASVTNPAGETSFYLYNDSGALTKFTDANGNVIEYTYNADNALTKISYQDGTFESYTYDADGNLSAWTGRGGQTATYTVDANGNYSNVAYSDGRNIAYTYNADGYTLTANDISFNYDASGNLTRQSYTDGRSIAYTYDADGRVLSYSDELGHAVNYTYTVNGGYDKLTDESGALIIDYDYDADGRLVKESKGNGSYTTYSYNSYGEVTAIDNYTTAGKLENYRHYTYDTEVSRVAMETESGAWAYTYDVNNQLTGAIFTDDSGAVTQNLAYTYDAMGNRLTATENGVTTTYTYNNLNQIVSANGFTYVYDANGNLLEDEKRTCTWTADNRVATETLKSTGQTWTYGYDALGNRISSATNGVTTSWTVDRNGNIIAEYADGAWNRTYYQGNLLSGFTDRNGGEYYFNADALGTTVSVSGADGAAVNTYSYDPWGNVLAATEGVANDFTYVGGYGLMQNDSGTYFVRARNYDPETGRWISPDPIGISGGDNLYAYCNNNTVTNFDVNGCHTGIYIDDTGTGVWHAAMNVNHNRLSSQIGIDNITAQAPLFPSSSASHAWDYDANSKYKSFSIYADQKMEEKMSAYIVDFNKSSFSSIWAINWCSLAVGRALETAKYSVPFGFRIFGPANSLFDKSAGSNSPSMLLKFLKSYDFIDQQNAKAKADLGEGTGDYDVSGNTYTFRYNAFPEFAIIKEKSKEYDEKGVLLVTLDGSESQDKVGFNQKDGQFGIGSYIWFELEKNEDTGKYRYKKSIGTESSLPVSVTYEEKVKYVGLAVADKQYAGNTAGVRISDGLGIWNVAVTTIAYDDVAPIANAGDNQSYSFTGENDNSHSFSVNGLASQAFGKNNAIGKYIWSLGDDNDSGRTITVNRIKEADGSYCYEWTYGSVRVAAGNSFTIKLTVVDADGEISKNTAAVTLSVTSDTSGSVDPNDKTVSEGAGEKGFVTAGAQLSYKVEFENDPEFATAPAQWVRVFDTLDSAKYDLDSFELRNFCIAGNYFEVGDGRDSYNGTVKLKVLDYTVTATISINLVTDEETGITQLVAEFMGVDPESGFMLQDLQNGLLPINDSIGTGEGYINYTINAKSDLISGTEITNTAKIYFDFNDPIETPTTLNTVDSDLPEIAGLDGVLTTISWSGKDATSGIAGYDVEYRLAGGKSWTRWLTLSPLVSAEFIAEAALYQFRVRANDLAGNIGAWSDTLEHNTNFKFTDFFGTVDASGNCSLNAKGIRVKGIIAAAKTDIAGGVSAFVALNAEASPCNVYGGGNDVSVGGAIALTISAGGYTGVIYGGSRAVSKSVAIHDVNLTINTIAQSDNQKLIAAGKGTSAWVVGGGTAVGEMLTANDIAISVNGATISRVVGGAQAQNSGVTATVKSVKISIENSTIASDIFGGGYAYDGGVSTVLGDTEIKISTSSVVTVLGNIYGGGANPAHSIKGGASLVKGDSTITFTGLGENLTLGTVSGDGVITGTVSGMRTLAFDNFNGEFSANLKNFDAVSFSGSSNVTYGGDFEFSTIKVEYGSYAEGFGFADGDKLLKIEVANSTSGFDLMAVDDTATLDGLQIEIYNNDALLCSFEYGQSKNGYSIEEKNGVLSLLV